MGVVPLVAARHHCRPMPVSPHRPNASSPTSHAERGQKVAGSTRLRVEKRNMKAYAGNKSANWAGKIACSAGNKSANCAGESACIALPIRAPQVRWIRAQIALAIRAQGALAVRAQIALTMRARGALTIRAQIALAIRAQGALWP